MPPAKASPARSERSRRETRMRSGLGLVASAASLALLAVAEPAHAAGAPVRNGVSQVTVTLTGEDGGSCSLDHDTAKAGPVTFTVVNRTATAIAEVELLSGNRILGEKENLAPGLPPVSFTITLGGGRYQVYCPGAEKDTKAFRVVGRPAPAPTGGIPALLSQGAKGYARYVGGVVDAMVTAVGRLAADVDRGDLAAAKAEYPQARQFYERIESSVEGFVLPGHQVTDNAGNLDYLIDMRASNLDPAVGWHGFHAVERDLFDKGRITDETKELAAGLVKHVGMLDDLVKTLRYRPEDLANGAAGLLEEVQTGKISGEEEAYSHYDLVDIAGNVEGAEQAFAFLAPGMEKIDPDLTKRVGAGFDAVKATLERYRDPEEPGGYRRYTAALKASDAARISRAVQALQEPLSRIAEKVASAAWASDQ